MSVTREAVWAVLQNPETYPLWLMHAVAVTRIDAGWPSQGSGVGYTLRWGPLQLTGRVTILQMHPPGHLRVRWRRGLLGSSTADITLERIDDRHTQLRLRESSDGLFVGLSSNPLIGGVRTAYNVTSLHRLERLAGAPSRFAGTKVG